MVAALVHGSGYERIASPGCSDATIRRRLRAWAAAGLSEQVHTLALRAYDRMIGLELEDLAVNGCLTKAPSGGEAAGRSPVDRGKQGLKRSVVTDGGGIPLHVVSAGANRHDAPLLGPTLAGLDRLDGLPEDVLVHLDRGGPERSRRMAAPPGLCSRRSASRGPSPARACPHPSRLVRAGWWNGRIVG